MEVRRSVDFQSLLADIDTAFQKILADEAAFDEFAKEVLGGDAQRTRAQETAKGGRGLVPALRRSDAKIAAPKPVGASARVDAVSMIFNRVAGLDIGTTSSSDHRAEHRTGRRARALSLPVERAHSGYDPVAGICPQRERHSWSARATSARSMGFSASTVRRLSRSHCRNSSNSLYPDPGVKLPQRLFTQYAGPHASRNAHPAD